MNIENKIHAKSTSIRDLLGGQKFYIDYFQREYRWQEKHIQSLIDDLTTAFLNSYDPAHSRNEVSNYQEYYLGPVIFSESKEGKSIIDGQQRITSITLLLIYLNNLQKQKKQGEVPIKELIFSEKYGEKSFNMIDEARKSCFDSLYNNGVYEIEEEDDETVKNMKDRYDDIVNSFPEDLTDRALPYFIDWFIENVVIVTIRASSDDSAYEIFETMNDRGLRLTSSEMLKGYVLSKIHPSEKREEIERIWKTKIQELHVYDKNADQSFFQAWFRGKVAESIRPGKIGAEDKDFELIGSKFHSWFKDNHEKKFNLKTSDDFYTYFKNEFPFYAKWCMQCWHARIEIMADMPHLYYAYKWGIAESLQDALSLASICTEDSEEEIKKKLDCIARYIEIFAIRRSVNNKNFSYNSIRYTIFTLLIKSIRSSTLTELKKNLLDEINKMKQGWDGIDSFRLHGQNRKFVKHLLSRISVYISRLTDTDDDYIKYNSSSKKYQYEIEHILNNKFDDHRDEFKDKEEFDEWRNRIGALILLPNRTNQSLKDNRYRDKLEHYIKENIYAKTLHKNFYLHNPRFQKSEKLQQLQFQHHADFKKDDIDKRTALVKRICEQLWSTDYFSDYEK